MTTAKLTKLGQFADIEVANGRARIEMVKDGVVITLPDVVVRPMVAQGDEGLFDWITNAADDKRGAGSFVRFFAKAAQVADYENYPELRPLVLKFKDKYPQYCEPSWKLDSDKPFLGGESREEFERDRAAGWNAGREDVPK